tara:strand:- start:230 stop:424 length:195 start_codon:yes stop_codon:yes gene_type:complete
MFKWWKRIEDKLIKLAMESPIRKWALELEGWKWWLYQIVVGTIGFAIIEYFLNLLGLTILPWRM